MPVPSRVPVGSVTTDAGRAATTGVVAGTPAWILHGFASSPASTKATYFTERLRSVGYRVSCPDLNAPDFQTLTLSRMLGQLTDALAEAPAPAVLVGSSLGGALALLAAAAMPERVSRLVLLAPAVMFGHPEHRLFEEIDAATWQRVGTHPFMHYGDGRERLLNWAFCEDAPRHHIWDLPCTHPALVFQGRQDTVVLPEDVTAFAAARPAITLRLLDDGHQLTAHLPQIWEEMSHFLGCA